MAALAAYLLLFTLGLCASANKRFSNIKRCADEECSMLLCRGKAARDFTGADCRFLTFKKGETIYVYYKLWGWRSDLWAGSVGSRFGYFPKDLLNVNHVYTEKELEVPAEETDFVCFDTGLDTFKSYDVDTLLASALAVKDDSSEIGHEEKANADTSNVPVQLHTDTGHNNTNDPHILHKRANEDLTGGSAGEDLSVRTRESETGTLHTKHQEHIQSEKHDRHADVVPADEEDTTEISPPDRYDHSGSEAEVTENISEGNLVPPAETTFGSTFDAVATDDENTLKVTQYDDDDHDRQEEVQEPEEKAEDYATDPDEIPLLAFSEDQQLTGESVNLKGAINKDSEEDEEEEEEDEEKYLLMSLAHADHVSGNETSDLDAEVQDEFPLDRYEEEEEEEQLSASEHHINPKPLGNEQGEKSITAEHSDPDMDEPEQDHGSLSYNIELKATEEQPGEGTPEPLLEEPDANNVVKKHEQSQTLTSVDFEFHEPKIQYSEDVREMETMPSEIQVKEPVEVMSSLDNPAADLTPHAVDVSASGSISYSQHAADQPSISSLDNQIAETTYTLRDISKVDLQDVPSPEPGSNIKSDAYFDTGSVYNVASEAGSDYKDSPPPEPGTDDIKDASYPDQISEPSPDVMGSPALDYDINAGDGHHTITHDLVLDGIAEGNIAEEADRIEQERTVLLKDTLDREMQDEAERAALAGQKEALLEDENAVLSSEAQKLRHEEEDGAQEHAEVQEEATEEAVTELSKNIDDEPMETQSGTATLVEEAIFSQDSVGDEESPSKNAGASEEYGDSVQRLTFLRSHFKDADVDRFYKQLGLKNLMYVEAMFTKLDNELKTTRLSQVQPGQDVEKSLENILEASETAIMEVIEKMLDGEEPKSADAPEVEDGGDGFDEEAALLDDFQELAFQLRQRYSTASDSTPLSSEEHDTPHIKEDILDGKDTVGRIVTVETEDTQETGVAQDSAHFNRNKDIQSGFQHNEDIQMGPQPILDHSLDRSFGIDVEGSLSEPLETPTMSDYHEEAEKSNSLTVLALRFFTMAHGCTEAYAKMVITSLPDDWQPGPTFYGFPWQPVLVTAAVGIITFFAFIWRTCLAVKSRRYQLTEKQLADRIKQLVEEKSEALAKITDLNQKIREHEEQMKDAAKRLSSSKFENAELKKSCKDRLKESERMTKVVNNLNSDLEEERRKAQDQTALMEQTQRKMEKFNRIIKSNKEELTKVHVLIDEARIREEALKAQVLCSEKENNTLKDQKKSLLSEAKSWEEKHMSLSEKIKVFQKCQKELEDNVAHKENEIEILSRCVSELQQLEVCENTEQHKGTNAPALANGQTPDTATGKRSETMKIRIKQMMDVSRVKATLAIVEEERNKYLGKLMTEEKQRQQLEEQMEKLEHERASLESQKCEVESQYKTTIQKLEIMSEMYQQKENALQQKLTQEEFERREKENKLCEVDGKALQAEEDLKAYKRRIQEIDEELQKTERSYKAQIALHEKKAHENWLNARAAERALVEEKRETANLRQKLVEVSDKLAELQKPMFKPAQGLSERPGRRGESYAPSPVSAGAPSPPLMIEGPGRPPSAPVGRRADTFGARTPSDPHSRYSELGHPVPARLDVYAPRTSSPSGLDGSRAPVKTESQSEAQVGNEDVISKSQGQPSFMVSPIRDASLPIASQPMAPTPLALPNRPPHGPPGPDPRYGPPPPAMGPGPYAAPRPFGSLPPPYVRGPPAPLRDFPMGPPPSFGQRDFHMPFPPRPIPHGPRDGPAAPPNDP